MKRESVVFYKDFFEAIRQQEPEKRLQAYEAIFEYAFYGEETEIEDPTVNTIFTLVKPQIDENNERYLNGCKGGRPRKEVPEPEEKKDKEKDVANTSEKSSCRGSDKDSYGRNGNVKLSMNEYNTLVKSYCEEVVNYYIEKLDNWLNDKHNRDRLDHYAELNKFIKNGGGIIPIRAKPGRRVANFADIGREKIDFKEFEEQFVENN